MKPKNLLFYYGYPNSFNSAQNGWDNDKVAEDMAKYSLIILGDGIADPGHADYANTTAIVPKVKALKKDVEIFGYVTVNQSYNDFKDAVDLWVNLGIEGIFLDEAGYDFGSVATNGRDAFNDKVDYIHSKGMKCFVNAWNINHVLGKANDASYPNTTYNPDELDSELEAGKDIYLFESLAVNTLSYSGNSGYETKSQWETRINQAIQFREDYGILMATVCVIDEGHGNAQALHNFAYISALMGEVDFFGSSSHNYGAGGAVTFYQRLTTAELEYQRGEGVIQNSLVDSDIYFKYLNNGRLVLDFSPLSSIVIY